MAIAEDLTAKGISEPEHNPSSPCTAVQFTGVVLKSESIRENDDHPQRIMGTSR